MATHGAEVVVTTTALDGDLARLTGELGFRVEAIFPADAPSTAVVSGHGTRLRLVAADVDGPVHLRLVDADRTTTVHLPGGSRIEFAPAERPVRIPVGRPALVVTHAGGPSGLGRAGMRYRDLLPGRWGGRFISSHITIPTGGPVPDYVHYHRIRFQLIFVKAGWVRVVYEDQGEPFVMHAGDAVLQPPEIRHRVLESSAGLEVIEVGCPAEHETLADHGLTLPNAPGDPQRTWNGQRFVRHVAAGAPYRPWRIAGWEQRDTGIGAATGGLAGVRVARPIAGSEPATTTMIHDSELTHLVVLRGAVDVHADGHPTVRVGEAGAVAIPGRLPHRLAEPTPDCELLDVTLPAEVA